MELDRTHHRHHIRARLCGSRMLAAKGYRQVIVTGRRLAQVQQRRSTRGETKKKVFTPLELDLDSPSSVQSALAELVKRVSRSISYCSMQGWSP